MDVEESSRRGTARREVGKIYLVGGVVLVASVGLPDGEVLLPGALPGELPMSVDGEAAGGWSRFGLSPTFPLWFESVQPAAAPARSANAKTSVRAFFISHPPEGRCPYPLICTDVATF
jgi:hypothetical protein